MITNIWFERAWSRYMKRKAAIDEHLVSYNQMKTAMIFGVMSIDGVLAATITNDGDPVPGVFNLSVNYRRGSDATTIKNEIADVLWNTKPPGIKVDITMTEVWL